MRILTGLLVCSTVCVLAEAEPRLTIYNQDFAVVRDTVSLHLASGVTKISHSDVSAHVEPDSVILRSLDEERVVRILEQNYWADPVSQPMLLSLYEGETIDFLVGSRGDSEVTVKGKIIRSGYVRHRPTRFTFNPQYYATQNAYSTGSYSQPVIEVNGILQFSLPGTPLFPSLPDDSILKPTLHWVLETDRGGAAEVELSYITGGMAWAADYNLVAPTVGDELDLTGWVTMDNQSGKTYENAQIKLMAGDVSKLQPQAAYDMAGLAGGRMSSESFAPTVTEKSFDEYHLYDLTRPTTLRDRETKQVEFMRASGIASELVYVYDGAWIDPQRHRHWAVDAIRNQPEYGTQSNPKIWVMREFENTEENGLGMPLPKGRMRFYRKDGEQLEFVGENVIDHTPKNETVRAYTGNAFDLVGERRQTNYNIDHNADTLDESFEIVLRNRKEEAVEIRVVEHLYRWMNWEVRDNSHPFEKKDSRTIEYTVEVPADGEVKITYVGHYWW